MVTHHTNDTVTGRKTAEDFLKIFCFGSRMIYKVAGEDNQVGLKGIHSIHHSFHSFTVTGKGPDMPVTNLHDTVTIETLWNLAMRIGVRSGYQTVRPP